MRVTAPPSTRWRSKSSDPHAQVARHDSARDVAARRKQRRETEREKREMSESADDGIAASRVGEFFRFAAWPADWDWLESSWRVEYIVLLREASEK